MAVLDGCRNAYFDVEVSFLLQSSSLTQGKATREMYPRQEYLALDELSCFLESEYINSWPNPAVDRNPATASHRALSERMTDGGAKIYGIDGTGFRMDTNVQLS